LRRRLLLRLLLWRLLALLQRLFGGGNRLRPSQGMTVSVVSKPAAMSKGLWARF